MDYRKDRLSAADNYAHAVGTWRVAEMLRAHHLGRERVVEVRIEDGRIEDWDDVTEILAHGSSSRLRGWQVRKRQSFAAADLKELLRSLNGQPSVDIGVLALEHPLSVKLHRGSSAVPLMNLRALTRSLNAPGADFESAETDETQRGWVEWVSSQLEIQNAVAKRLLARLRIEILGDLDAIRTRSLDALQPVTNEAEHLLDALHGYLWDNFSGPVAHTVATIHTHLLARPAYQLRPTHVERREARAEYLSALESFAGRRQPLRGLLHGETVAAGLWMQEIELPARLVAHAGEFSGDASVPAVRERPLLIDVLDRRRAANERPYLCVVGEVGAGKSTLAEQTATKLAHRASLSPEESVPMLVTAADLPMAVSRRAGRYSHLLKPESYEALQYARWIYLVDAYDELDADGRDRVDAAIDELLEDARTTAMVVFTRSVGMPARVPARARYNLEPWDEPEMDAFVRRWRGASNEELPTEFSDREMGLLRNPLTATLFLAHLGRFGEGPVNRAGLFCAMVESFFRDWADVRPASASVRWADLAPVFEELAYELLRSNRSTFEETELVLALQRLAPRETELISRLVRRELGLLVRRPDGSYEFLLRPLAEHLAGRHLTGLPSDRMQRVAAAGWAGEPVRHCIGLHALEGRASKAETIIGSLCTTANSELETVGALRCAGVAARAASDVATDAHAVAGAVGNALLVQLVDGSSSWRPLEAQTFAHDLLGSRSQVADIFREQIKTFLDQGTDAVGLTYVHPELRDLYHRSGAVRALAVRSLGEQPDLPGVRNLLFTMMMDHGRDDLAGMGVAIEAALALRSATRDAAFVTARVI